MEGSSGAGGGGGQFTFPSVLHFLHREHVKFERERKWWLAEKAELQARISFLEGQRLGEANLKRDLLRRIKMLEAALQRERGGDGAASAPTDDQSAAPDDAAPEGAVIVDKEGRHVLLQYLSEMQYTDAVIEAQAQRVRGMLDSWSPTDTGGANWRLLGTNGKGISRTRQDNDEHDALDDEYDDGDDGDDDEDVHFAEVGDDGDLDDDDNVDDFLVGMPVGSVDGDAGMTPNLAVEKIDQNIDQTIPDELPIGSSSGSATSSNIDTDAEDKLLQERIMKQFGSGGKMSKRMNMGKKKGRLQAKAMFDTEPDLESKLGELSDVNASSVAVEAQNASIHAAAAIDAPLDNSVRKTWRMKMELRGHLDGVREVLFHPHEPLLVSVSEDATAAVWQAAPTPDSKLVQVSEPLRILRGHTAPVYAATFTPGGVLYTGGADCQLIAWQMPSPDASRYPLASAGQKLAVTDGLDDVVWSLDAHPSSDILVSGTADGVCKLWDTTSPNLRERWSIAVNAPVTSVQFVRSDSTKILVGAQDGAVSLLDAETGQKITEFKDDSSDDGEGTGYLYDARSHPTMGVLACAYGAKYVKVFDIKAGVCVHTMVAHPSAVSSIDFDPSGLYLVSSGHNRSVRIWDFGAKKCVHEHTTHRHKHYESIHAARFHPSAAYFASAGADSIVKVYS